MAKIAVLGSGAWGTALGDLLLENKNEVLFYGVDSSEIDDINKGLNSRYFGDKKIHGNPKATLNTKDVIAFKPTYILIAVPASFIVSTISKIINDIDWPCTFINVAKGLDSKTNDVWSKSINAIISSKQCKLVTLMGPSFAVDVFAQVPTIVNLLQEDIELASEVAKLFNNYRFACVPSTDVIGGQITSALKNVLAVICGYVDNLSINTKAAIFCEGIKEIYNFVKIYGGKADTIVDFCGIGDIYLTCTDSKSRNFTLGLELQENDYDNTPSKLTNKTVEGYVTFPIIYDFIKKNNVKAPLFEEFYDLLYNNSVSKENFIAELFKKICSK